MSPDEAERFLFSTARFGVEPGLSPTRLALDALGAPDRAVPAVQIVGTVGKGSTAAFLESILRAHGLCTGRFTSPHLVSVTERFAVNAEPVPREALARALDRVREAAPWTWDQAAEAPASARPLTFFEWCTVLAQVLFHEAGVEVAVLEAGLGGRWDATSACRIDALGLSRVDLDHTAVLGESLEAVADEKLAALREGVPLVVGPQDEVVFAKVEAAARVGDHRLHAVEPDYSDVLPLSGNHQRENAALARGLAAALGHSDPKATARGIRQTRWPARFQQVASGLFVDGAHNPVGCRALAETLRTRFGGGPVDLFFGCLSDRDALALLDALDGTFESLTLVTSGSPRDWDPAGALPAIRERWPDARLGTLTEVLEASDRPRLVTGSMYLAGAVLAQGEGRAVDPGDPAAT